MFHFFSIRLVSLVENRETEALFMSPAGSPEQICYSLYRPVPGAALQTRPLYFFVDFLNHPFIPDPCHLPPLCAQTGCTEDAPSPGDYSY